MSPPPKGGNKRYLLVTLLLLAGSVGLYLASGSEEPGAGPAVQQPEPVKPKTPPRSTALVEQELEIPEEEPDAGPAPAPEKPRRRSGRRKPVVGPWDCGGDLPAVAIRKVLRESNRQIRNCYERQLKLRNTLQGQVRLQVRVDANGKVARTRVSGSLRDTQVRQCIRALADKWELPEPKGDSCAVFEQPYNFTPKF